MGKVKVDLKAACEFAAQGFEIECYVVTGKTSTVARRTPSGRTRRYAANEKIQLTVGGKMPKQGKLGLAWEEIRKKLLKEDPTLVSTVGKARDICDKHDAGRSGVAKLVNAYKCLRIVDDK